MQKSRIPFRSVNSACSPGYNASFHRHHILPRQLLTCRCFHKLFDTIGRKDIDFDDFRLNGMLLPANSTAALRTGLPLHRGPHREYNVMTIDRVGMIERDWSVGRLKRPSHARRLALRGLKALQSELNRRLLDPIDRNLSLNRQDPYFTTAGFADLDAMADALWSSSVQHLANR